MKLSTTWLWLYPLAVAGHATVYDSSPIGQSTTINTTSGRFGPIFPASHPDVASFLDIPYARAPVGALRFAPPVPAIPPEGNAVQHASNLPTGCLQYTAPGLAGTVGFVAEQGSLFQRGSNANTSEDCLRLTIFAPKTAVSQRISLTEAQQKCSQGLLPVIVWVHGGGFTSGGINTPYTLSSNWVQRSQRHIVVHVQYRLNLLGFPSAAGLSKQQGSVNLGFLDQRQALQWVRDNIASLGGDPKRIVLWGESAGASSVDAYLFSWNTDPIVAGVIADSGSALSLKPYSAPVGNYSQFSHIASQFKCGSSSPVDELNCMRNISSSSLKHFLQTQNSPESLTFPIIEDNITSFANYSHRIALGRRGFPEHIPLLIGSNTNEGNVLVPYDFNGSANAIDVPNTFAAAAQTFKLGLQCSAVLEARLRAKAGAKTWQYLYSGNFTDLSPRPWLGAYHTAELPLIFGTIGMEGSTTGFERRVSEYMQDLYVAFATDPVNGLINFRWPIVSTSPVWRVMLLAANNTVARVTSVESLQKECIKHGFPI